jgi:hypothetical protein
MLLTSKAFQMAAKHTENIAKLRKMLQTASLKILKLNGSFKHERETHHCMYAQVISASLHRPCVQRRSPTSVNTYRSDFLQFYALS